MFFFCCRKDCATYENLSKMNFIKQRTTKEKKNKKKVEPDNEKRNDEKKKKIHTNLNKILLSTCTVLCSMYFL